MIDFGIKHKNICQQCKREKEDCCELTSSLSDKKYILCLSCVRFFDYFLNHPKTLRQKNKK
jgi:hypothetical protein